MSGGDGAQTSVLWHQGLLLNSQNLKYQGKVFSGWKQQLCPKADPLSTLSVKGKWILSTESTYTFDMQRQLPLGHLKLSLKAEYNGARGCASGNTDAQLMEACVLYQNPL